MIMSKKLITKALINLRVCAKADWSVHLLLAKPQRQVFSCRGPYKVSVDLSECGRGGGNYHFLLPFCCHLLCFFFKLKLLCNHIAVHVYNIFLVRASNK